MLISYVLVHDQRNESRMSIFSGLREGEIELLRCLMTLQLLPGDADAILPTGRPFFEAASRVSGFPKLRVTTSAPTADPVLWAGMLVQPLVVVMVGASIPAWLGELARNRPVALLTSVERTFKAAATIEGVSAGFVRETHDLVEFYRVLGEMARAAADRGGQSPEVCESLRALAQRDLFHERSRLAFLPALPLPPLDQGRPAAFLLNRLSNNVERPGLVLEPPKGGSHALPAMLTFGLAAARAFALVELGIDVPPQFPVPPKDLAELHTEIQGESDDERKCTLMMDLGKRLVEAGKTSAQFATIPAPRSDFMLGRVPEGMELDPGHDKVAKVGAKALRDALEGVVDPPKDPQGAAQYERSRETFLLEQRVLACVTAVLASRCDAVPVQLPPVRSHVYNDVRDLSVALDNNSKKVPELFRRVEESLSQSVPQEALLRMGAGDEPLTLLSDLPFEWAAVDGWPLCLTRPVSRIPLGLGRWDTLCAVLEGEVTIDSADPQRTLVLDWVPEHDAIRKETDDFISVSEGLKLRYVYASPATATECRGLLEETNAEIVVVDAHGSYERRTDLLRIGLAGGPALVEDLLPAGRVPPIWILSACDTSVTGAMRGCFVRELLRRGAVCVVATLARVDAFTASMFVGRLLTDIYSPVARQGTRSFADVFFRNHVSTAVLYDPLLPMLRKSRADAGLRKALGPVLGGYFAWLVKANMSVRVFRHEAALVLHGLLQEQGLAEAQQALHVAGQLRPETLLFSAFGAADRVRLND